ncbi:hypothetical protein [Microbulbifer hainanensis]|uniref:hypothetical protein n=1 Tax=Microbulbifer hainanensis TaxID=2735675 RepID=UPI001867FF3D|nr:hypothetical protein [Microbulbifer hainanensis]
MEFLTRPYQRALCFVCLLLISGASTAKTHPSYLSPKYCESVAEQFVDSGMRSLGKYVNENFNPEFKGGIRNTVDFLNQRSDWLSECDDYLADTSKDRIFYSPKLTKKIFSAITELSRELQHVREGVEYPDDAGNNNPTPFIKQRYDTLAKLVDQYHTRMLMKKQFQ